MRALLIVILATLLGTAALAQGWWLHARLAYLLGAALVLSAIWSWLNVRAVTISRRITSSKAQVGKTVAIELTIRNTSPLPKLWLEIRDRSTMPGYRVGVVRALGGRQTAVWSARVECQARGIFRIGPIVIRSGDPFGFFTHQRIIPTMDTITVYPRTVPLPGFAVPNGSVPSDRRLAIPSRESVPNATGVREHWPGESLNRIHWPTTARTGRFMAREFAMDPSSDIWIVLDGQATVHVGLGNDSTEEYAVTAAASLAKHYLDANLAVGLVASSSELQIVDVDRGPNHVIRLLESLAIFRADGRPSLAELLTREERRFTARGTRTGLVVVTPTADDSWVPAAGDFSRRGIGVIAVIVEATTFGGRTSPLGLVGALAAAGIPTFLIKRGEPLDQALVAPQIR